jgi:cysteine-rich repeat protein
VTSASDRASLIASLRSIQLVGGDGSLDAGEECDDGNGSDDDGCSRGCAVETGFTCAGAPARCEAICGDGAIVGAEACDDSNTAAGDGCSSACAVEPGYTCTGLPSACTLCGNGAIEGAETCDDGNQTDGDCCSVTCRLQACTLRTVKDSFIRSGAPNANEGANLFLLVRSTGRTRVASAFDPSAVAPTAVAKATLILTVEQNLGELGPTGRAIAAHALLQDFAEGNGRLLSAAPATRGAGAGITFACATDTNISNQGADCGSPWNGGAFAATPSSVVTHTNATRGEVSFDGTADVRAGRAAWLVKLADELRSGAVRYWSREGAAEAGDPDLGARLRIEY